MIDLKLKTKKRYILLILLSLIFFVSPYELMADEENGENRIIPLGEVDSLRVTIRFGAGKLGLISGQEDVFEGNFQYDKSTAELDVEIKGGLLDVEVISLTN